MDIPQYPPKPEYNDFPTEKRMYVLQAVFSFFLTNLVSVLIMYRKVEISKMLESSVYGNNQAFTF